MQQVCDYARDKGASIRVRVHRGALYPRPDEPFALFEKWGIKGMMVDFMDRDDQEMVNIQEDILKKLQPTSCTFNSMAHISPLDYRVHTQMNLREKVS